MFKKIVWATDGSENSERALEYVKSLALESGASLVAAHCEEILISAGGRGGPQLDPGDAELNHPKIAEQVAQLRRNRLGTFLLRDGDVSTTLTAS